MAEHIGRRTKEEWAKLLAQTIELKLPHVTDMALEDESNGFRFSFDSGWTLRFIPASDPFTCWHRAYFLLHPSGAIEDRGPVPFSGVSIIRQIITALLE